MIEITVYLFRKYLATLSVVGYDGKHCLAQEFYRSNVQWKGVKFSECRIFATHTYQPGL